MQNESGTQSALLTLSGIDKHFGGVYALKGVQLNIVPGRVHGLVGENGAGKSTLVNIATGVLQPDAGMLSIRDKHLKMENPMFAAACGVVAVHQESELFAQLSLAENMLLGQGLVKNRIGLVDWKKTYQQARSELSYMQEHLDVRWPAEQFSVGRRIIAEIAAAIARDAKVLFLDEPTASLTAAESVRLFKQIEKLKAAGVGIVYISHRLEEVLEICDTITVLRDGAAITTEPAERLDMNRLVSLMVGRDTTSFFSRTHGKPTETVFEAKKLTSFDKHFSDVSFSVRSGEIVGMYGLVGSGRSEIARAIFGLEPAKGTLCLNGKPVRINDPISATKSGIAYVPEDRLTEAIFANHSCQSNVTSAILRRISRLGIISGRQENRITQRVTDDFSVKLDRPAQPINTLSGGNQQKLVLGRWLETKPKYLILDEPTRGVDVGAKIEIHKLIDQLAAEGMAILLISSELPEVMRMSDRVLVMCEGRLAGQFDARAQSEEQVAATAFPKADTSKRMDGIDRKPHWGHRLLQFREFGIVAALAAIVCFMSIFKFNEFTTIGNMLDILTAASILSVGAAGMTLVIITGGIDISVGSLLGLIGAVAGLAAMKGVPPSVCLLIALSLGVVFGSINSTLSTLGRIHPIIVTLAGISIYRGIMLQITGGYEVNPLPQGYRAMTDGLLLNVPRVLWYAVLILAANWVFLTRTLKGRQLLAAGNSRKALHLIGLSAWKLQLLAFALMGALVGLASVMWGGYYGKIQSNTGQGWELQVIAAAVIGGCSIVGGRGTALGTFLGAVLIALIYNSLVILRVSSYWQDLFIGVLILGAVMLDVSLPKFNQWLQRRRERGR